MIGTSLNSIVAVLLKAGLSAVLAGAIVGGEFAALWSVAAAAGPVARPATRYDRVFGNVFYKVPAGYRAVQQAGGVTMVRTADTAAGTVGGVLLITPGLPLTATLRKQLVRDKTGFVQNMAIAFGNLTKDPNSRISKPLPVNDGRKDGYEAFALSADSFDKDAQQNRHTIFVIVLTPSRVEGFMKIAYGAKSRLKALDAGFDALIGSAEFRNTGAPPPSRIASPLPGNLAAILPSPAAKPPQTAAKGTAAARPQPGGSCRIVQRQMCSGGIGSGLGYFCNTYPQRVCN